MANNYRSNPIYLDTFSADATLFTGSWAIYDAIFYSNGSTDHLWLEDGKGDCKLILGCSQNYSAMFSPSKPIRGENNLVLDVSDGTYNGTFIRALIYV